MMKRRASRLLAALGSTVALVTISSPLRMTTVTLATSGGTAERPSWSVATSVPPPQARLDSASAATPIWRSSP